MRNLKEYKYDISKFFEECELKSVTWDTQDDSLWLATFESKSGKTRQYKTNRQTMLAFCKKFYRDLSRLEDKAKRLYIKDNEMPYDYEELECVITERIE